jgi:sulfate adenylyltransferase subunit 2
MQNETSRTLIQQALVELSSGDLPALGEYISTEGHSLSERQIGRLLGEVLPIVPIRALTDVLDAAGFPLNPIVVEALEAHSKTKRWRLFFGQITSSGGRDFLVANDRRGALVWSHLAPGRDGLLDSIQRIKDILAKDLLLVPLGDLQRLAAGVSMPDGVEIIDYAHRPLPFTVGGSPPLVSAPAHRHLDQLEAESIRIIREAVAVAKRPGMLFSMGKDSMVMWTLAKKAFWPEPPPFPLSVIDTRWKFREMYKFREFMADLPATELRVHINPVAIEQDVNPFDFGSARHTEITKTHALKQVLEDNQYDFVFGGARRDEEKSRAKERVFSVRNERQGWDPKTQRPELWNLYNTVLPRGHSMRVFPISNWTELDIWRYIERENIPLVPLYFSKIRPFVERDGALIMVDDDRFRLEDGEKIHFAPIRFRTLGCYPLTGGMRSNAMTVAEIIAELEESRVSERSSRVIDFDPGASMEQKKKEGYF